MSNIADNRNLKIYNKPLERVRADAIVIPQAHDGSVGSVLMPLAERAGLYPGKNGKLGTIDVRPVTIKSVNFKYIVFAVVTAPPVGPTYSAVREIGIQLGQFAENHEEVRSIACSVIGAGTDLISLECVKILAKAFSENSQKELHIHTNEVQLIEDVEQLNISEFVSTSSRRFALAASVRKALNHVVVAPILHAPDFWFDLAKQKFEEYLKFDPKAEDFFRDLQNNFHEVWTGGFEETLNSYAPFSAEYKFLLLCGELVAYIDENAANKRIWNRNPDRRTLALARVNQFDWIVNLIRFRAENSLENIAPNVSNAIRYLTHPEADLNMLSNRHRIYLMKNIYGIDYHLAEDLDSLFNQFYFWGVRPTNSLNNGALITRILYLDHILPLWIEEPEKKQDTLFPGNLEPVGEPVLTDERKPRAVEANFLNDRYAVVDLLNYKYYAKAIAAFIDHKNTEPPLTIGILAPWGKGKTTLMRFIEENLADYRSIIPPAVTPNTNTHPDAGVPTYGKFKRWINRVHSKFEKANTLEYPTVWFNAWKYQQPDQVWAGLAHEIIHQLVKQLPTAYDREEFWLRMNLKRFDKEKLRTDITLKIFNKAIRSTAGIIYLIAGLAMSLWLNSFAESAYVFSITPLPFLLYCWYYRGKQEKEKIDFDISKYIKEPDYAGKRGYFHEVEDDLKEVMELLIDSGKPAVIFIDDLDRCSPNVVASVVEAINLFISGDFPRVYFVLGQDAQMVAASLDVAYSKINKGLSSAVHEQGSLGWHFMEKFVQMQFCIPAFNELQAKEFFRRSFTPARVNSLTTRALDLGNAINAKDAGVPAPHIAVDMGDQEMLMVKQVTANIMSEIEEAAEKFDDNDPELQKLIEAFAPFVATSPRAIKRFINLFRFYSFLLVSERGVKIQNLHLGQWIVIMIRWPQLVRAIQWNTESDWIKGFSATDRARAYEKNYSDLDAAIGKPAWAADPDLISFIDICQQNGNVLESAVVAGVW